MLIPIDKIKPPKIQLRHVNKESVEYFELRESIQKDGILQPILVRPLGDGYEVVEGNWRYRAALDIDLTEIPCLVKEYSDSEVEVIQLKANAIRPQTSMADFSNRLHDLMDRRNLTLSELAALVNKGAPWLRRILTLRKLSQKAKKAVDRGEVTVQNAVALATLPKHMQENFLPHAVVETGQKFEEMVRVAVKEWREFCQGDRTAWTEYQASHTTAYLRQMHEIVGESKTKTAAGLVLLKMDAKTPLDGWKACLAWLLHLDPDSLEQQGSVKGVYGARGLEFANRRKENRMLLKELRSKEPESFK